jgi:hypothetical protein
MQNSSLSTPKKTAIKESRDVKKVPFVELLDKRLQGIVSSGSDIERVYVSYFEAGTLNYGCATNNNRPCGGLRGYPCSHLIELLNEAVIQYGFDEVVDFLRLNVERDKLKTIHDILQHKGRGSGETAGEIFSRFLNDLEYLELPADNRPLDTMAWFVE